MAGLTDALASRFSLGNEGFAGGGGSRLRGRGWGEKAGSARGFICRVVRGIRKGSREGLGTFQTAPVDFHRCRAMAGQKKEGERRGRKVNDAADEWVQTRSEREG